MSLESYRGVVPWGPAIRREVLERRMPPWQPEEGLAGLRGARLLSSAEIDILADWISGAMPEGDESPVAAGNAPRRPVEQRPPDLVLVPKFPTLVGPDDSERSECVILEAPLADPGWLHRLEFRPGNLRVVRRAVIWQADGCDPAAAPLYVWVPGQSEWRLPEGFGERVALGASFGMEIEYLKRWEDDGVELSDQSTLALWFSATGTGPARRIVTGAGLELEGESEVLSLIGVGVGSRPLRLRARLPSGESRLLFEVREPDPLWLGRYEPSDPMRLPPGTMLSATGGEVVIELAAR